MSREKEQERSRRIPRRSFLKRVLPGSWIPELARGKPLSEDARISLTKDVALFAATALIATEARDKEFKEIVRAFSWADAKDEERLREFAELLADRYLQLTQTTRINKEDLVGEGRLVFLKNKQEFINAVRQVEPTFDQTDLWGYTHYGSGKVFIDLGSLRDNSPTAAGIGLIDGLWHEWGHLDVEQRTTGELLNNPNFYFKSPVSEQNEQWRRYRGGIVYTQTYFGFRRFDEVWNETINVRRINEQIGITELIGAGNFFENGLDFFPELTRTADIPLHVLYQMHATSDFEGFAELVGSSLPLFLPGPIEPLNKGLKLFLGIHRSDQEMIRSTGALDLIGRYGP